MSFIKKSLTNSEYADMWKKESDLINANRLYKGLADLLPSGNVLEIGCGCGNGTLELCKTRKVLSLDINPFLIDKTKELVKHSQNVTIHKCDFLQLKRNDKAIITEFMPEIIVGWFLGGNGIDVLKHTLEETVLEKKPRLYREKLEDKIISSDVCLPSVKIIHLATRGTQVESFTDTYSKASVREDYNTYVFNKIGFEVTQVDFFDWDDKNSDFQYVAAENPLLVSGNQKKRITSIIASRIKN